MEKRLLLLLPPPKQRTKKRPMEKQQLPRNGWISYHWKKGSHNSSIIRIPSLHSSDRAKNGPDPFDRSLFRQQLQATIQACCAQGNSSLWIHVPMELSSLLEETCEICRLYLSSRHESYGRIEFVVARCRIQKGTGICDASRGCGSLGLESTWYAHFVRPRTTQQLSTVENDTIPSTLELLGSQSDEA
ncbi:hypothetical protein ACA910_011374 [Epithemia clementina (nom. ined.)]